MFKIIYIYSILLTAPLPGLLAKKVRVDELTRSWTLRDKENTVKVDVAKIPSGVYSALKDKYGDILDSGNDVKLGWIANKTWIYNTTFEIADDMSQDNLVNLTLHGIDTVAKIWLNDQLLGETNNMFVRYSFSVGHLLLLSPARNHLEIELLSPLAEAKKHAEQMAEEGISAPPECPRSAGYVHCHQNLLRKMQMSFGGEWQPAAVSSGIWKSITIEYYTVAILRDVDVAIRRNDTHWTMDCRAIISTPDLEKFYGQLLVYASELKLDEPFEINQQELSYASPYLEFKLDIPKERVKLWWPNGYGAQQLYPILFSLKSFRKEGVPSMSSRTVSQKLLHIGFRTIELVEQNDTLGRTFYFRVNDHPIFMKGVNYVPAHALPELSADADTIQHLLTSAQATNMNMIRVWGGGLYESDAFYSLADAYGLLVWQDMTFSKATYPINDELMASMRLEAAQNAQRLAYHPSLALIVTNNEIELYLVKNRTDFGTDAKRLEDDYNLLFLGNLCSELNIISRKDFSPRPGPMISTPSVGIIESGKELAKDPQSPYLGDVHIYEDEKDFSQLGYPQARFVSEFGYASLPIRSSWQRLLNENQTDADLANLIKERQHDVRGLAPIMSLIEHQLPFVAADWEKDIDQFIYFSQIAQAMATKLAVDVFRSRRVGFQTMGALMWQLNDVWVAPTRSIIDYFGNYKLVYYWAKDFLTSTNIIALYNEPSDQLNITITREDYKEDYDMRLYNVIINTFLWNDIFDKKTIARAIGLRASSIERISIPLESVLYEGHDKAELFLEIVVKDQTDEIVAQNFFYPVPIKNIVGIKDPEIKVDVVGECSVQTSGFSNNFSLRITVKYPALFVYLELIHPQYANYRHSFSSNGFTQIVPRQNIYLKFENDSECLQLSTQHISVKTMNQYLV